MANKWLGDRIDVHHGGEDLIFPHHENEIAQTEAATGKAPYVKYWLHNAFVNIAKEKMSKSLGNIVSAREFLTRFSGEMARFMFLSVHYRSIIDFGEESIENALTALQRIYEAKEKAVVLRSRKQVMPDPRAESLWGSFVADCEKIRHEMDEAMGNDFNTPGVLAAVFNLVREFNRVLSEPRAQETPASILGATEFIRVLEGDLGEILGIGRAEPQKMLADLARIRLERRVATGAISSDAAKMSETEIRAAIQARADARKAKDFARADQIRKDLEAKGVILKDGPQGTSWQYR